MFITINYKLIRSERYNKTSNLRKYVCEYVDIVDIYLCRCWNIKICRYKAILEANNFICNLNAYKSSGCHFSIPISPRKNISISQNMHSCDKALGSNFPAIKCRKYLLFVTSLNVSLFTNVFLHFYEKKKSCKILRQKILLISHLNQSFARVNLNWNNSKQFFFVKKYFEKPAKLQENYLNTTLKPWFSG